MRAGMLESGCIAAEAVGHESRNPADGCDADASDVVNPPIWQVLLQKTDDAPAVDEGLQFGWRA